jgi:hypothetical protein
MKPCTIVHEMLIHLYLGLLLLATPNSIPRYAQYISVKFNQQYHINVG